MPTHGTALVAFMDRDQAVRYLATECAPINPDPIALEAEWNTAVGRRAAPIANAGRPAIQDIPVSHQASVAALTSSPHWQQLFQTNPHWELKLIEVAPLLAYQFAVLDGPCATHGARFSQPPTMDELFDVCLPMNPVIENYSVSQQPHSVLIRSHSLNLRPLQVGPIGPSAFGVMVGVALPFVHVVRFNGRCFLHNGYHRATAAALAGAPEIPCVFRDVAIPKKLGLVPERSTWQCSSQPTPRQSIISPAVRHILFTCSLSPGPCKSVGLIG